MLNMLLSSKYKFSYLKSSVEPVFHNCNEFLVAQLPISIFIKNLEHSVH